ncbi:MAG: hypothetical protein ACFB0D_00405 [Phormidesmis sp.]
MTLRKPNDAAIRRWLEHTHATEYLQHQGRGRYQRFYRVVARYSLPLALALSDALPTEALQDLQLH